MIYFKIKKDKWDSELSGLTKTHLIYAPVKTEGWQDYELINPDDVKNIIYNTPKPVTPLKTFFLPVKENVTSRGVSGRPRIILGVPNCDIEGLSLPREIYLDPDFDDIFFRERVNNTLIISADCLSIQEHCHCTSYGIDPFSAVKSDLSVILMNDDIIIRCISGKGEEFIKGLGATDSSENGLIPEIDRKHKEIISLLRESNKDLPDFSSTAALIEKSGDDIWLRHSAKCVSCGACTTICPTCTCFLLIDKPGFEKVKQMDACQYPGFERVAGGEDPLLELAHRFKNRYLCKYIWKSRKFSSIACTGCGRCIEACIGKINKNEIFRELAVKTDA